MEKESNPVAVEDKYAQRYSVKWIFTPLKFAFKKTNSAWRKRHIAIDFRLCKRMELCR